MQVWVCSLNNTRMTAIVMFTDFGATGPYLGQMEAVLVDEAPHARIINLLSNAPTGNPRLSSYLLAALRHAFPPQSVFLCVVDPGVGGERLAAVLLADGHYFVGPDNGLLNTIAVQAESVKSWEITWKPQTCSSSFHGRDIFAPVAAALAKNQASSRLNPTTLSGLQNWQADLAEIIYCDSYGNAITGLRYHDLMAGKLLQVHGQHLQQAETFCALPPGEPFWYKNSNGLVEIAVNQGNAKEQLHLALGDKIVLDSSY
jgi:S-adenosyl-L-methionine hydrolase (adenosine-forming)